MKDIIIFEDSSKNTYGGGQKVTEEVVKILSDNYNLYLFDCTTKSVFVKNVQKYVKSISKIFCYGKIVNGKSSASSIGLLEIFSNLILFPVNLIYLIIKFRKFSENSIISVASKKALFYAFILSKLYRIKYIYHVHTCYNLDNFYSRLLYYPIKNAHKIICVSNFIARSMPFNHIEVVYNPIKCNLDAPPRRIDVKREINVALIGTLIRLKGVDYFIQSYKYLKSDKPIYYHIYGTGIEEENFRCLAKGNNKIIFHGFVNNIEDELRKIDILVVASIAEESFGLTAIEAFNARIPVITTNVGGQAEIVDDTVGLKVNVKSSQELAEKIDYLISNPEIYYRMSKNTVEYIKKFSIDEFKKRILEIFNN